MSKIIVIDGLDGSGKATQADKVYQLLKKRGRNVHKIEFPTLGSESSAPIRMYLRGEFGSNPLDINPYTCSTLYAVDRAIQYNKVYKDLLKEEDCILIMDRYISANIIHQGGKISDVKAREEFFKWAYEFETGLIGIPKEDMTICLEVHPLKSQELLGKRYLGNEGKRDIHEANLEYLNMCYSSYKTAIEYMNKEGYNWKAIDCLNDRGNIRSIDDIFKDIMVLVESII